MDAEIQPEIKGRLAAFRNLELYAIETRWVGSLTDMQARAQDHLDHQVDLERRGILFAAGPLFEPDAPRFPPTGGLIVIRAASFEDAEAIAKSDPMHESGLRTFTIRKWIINEGALQLTVHISDDSARLS